MSEKTTTTKVEEYGFQAEMEQLLHLLIHSLYTHKEIFLRELLSNSSDALQKIRVLGLTEKGFLDEGADLKIDIVLDDKKKELIISDSGVGMTHDELISNIGTIASSGTIKFLKELNDNKDEKKKNEMIGQFGVGFYSVFMVAEEVSISTRSYLKGEKAWKWTSKGTGKYTLEEIEKETRGTEIHIKLKKDEDEYAQDSTIKNIIQKYSNFVEFPINVGEEHANKSSAIWRKQASQVKKEERMEFYKFISHDFEDPMGHIHVNAEAPIAYSSLLFIPAKGGADIFQRPEDFHVHLYVKKVFIQNDCKDLLPPYLRFVHGVVDSEDLDLNVSREVTQHSSVMAKMKKILTKRLLKEISKWAEKDVEKYEKFYSNFGNVIKEGIESDFENKDTLINLMRFNSIKNDKKKISFEDYVKEMKPEQKEIYYLTGKSVESMLNNPNLEYFNEKAYDVLLLDEVIDDYLMPVISKFNEKELVSIERAEVDLKSDSKDDIDSVIKDSFVGRMKTILGDKLEDVKESKRLLKSPCTLVVSKDGMNSHMEQMMKMMNPDFEGGKKILEINMTHPLIKKIVGIFQSTPDSDDLKKAVESIYQSALLLDNRLEEPSAFVEKMYEYMDAALADK